MDTGITKVSVLLVPQDAQSALMVPAAPPVLLQLPEVKLLLVFATVLMVSSLTLTPLDSAKDVLTILLLVSIFNKP